MQDVWVVVGSSGVGKSSLINLFCDDDVKVSGGSGSCSKKVEGFCSNANKVLLIDTIGTEDSDGITNEEIVVKVLKFIYERKIKCVKIVWMMNPDIRKTTTLQKQALFINSFCEKLVWSSVVIIVKGKSLRNVEKFCQGACSAIKDLGVSGDIIGKIGKISYTCWDWLSEDEKEENEDLTLAQRKKRCIFDENGVKLLILDTMKQCKSCQVIFEDDECMKCGEIGDFRILPPKCHFREEKYHPSNELVHKNTTMVSKHTAGKLRRHKGSSQEKKEHDGELKPYYVDEVRRDHTQGTEYFHPGRFENQTGGRVISGIFSLGISEVANWGYWTCCKAHDEGTTGCKERWACCNGGPSSAGCNSVVTQKYVGNKWSCCDRYERLGGCRTVIYWDCCKKTGANAAPCDEFYPCCGVSVSDDNNDGCVKYYPCCKQDSQSNGCVLKCCKKAANEDGCKLRCQKCGGEWNNPKFKGCGIGNDYKHQVKQDKKKR